MNKILEDLGVFPYSRGYKYLQRAIELMMSNPTGIMKVYAEVAKEFNITAKGVEQVCRYTIREGWLCRDTDMSRKVFGNNDAVPTVGKYIKGISRYLRRSCYDGS